MGKKQVRIREARLYRQLPRSVLLLYSHRLGDVVLREGSNASEASSLPRHCWACCAHVGNWLVYKDLSYIRLSSQPSSHHRAELASRNSSCCGIVSGFETTQNLKLNQCQKSGRRIRHRFM